MSLADVLVTIVVIVSSTNQFYADVASRCNGEASFALEACATTVRNRVQSGINPDSVLDAYFAPDRPYSSQDVELVKGVFESSENPLWWYLLGTGLDDHWRPHDGREVVKVCHPEYDSKLCVLIFEK